MEEAPDETADHHDLADHAETLCRGLRKLRHDCGHESTSIDIANVAGELMLLATELRTLDRAVNAHKEQYTQAFDEDLEEIRAHLTGIFEDIADCCREMQKADGPGKSTVGWLQKKRYVSKLQKHLEANKTALVVMRTVLHHGKVYGTQNSSGRLAESSPHVMQEDRAILESIFASRRAISDLHDLTNRSHEHSASSSSTTTADMGPSFKPGAHGRNLSSATGVDTPTVEDVLPTSNTVRKKRSDDPLTRRFSRRGVRLAVHSSILDSNAHQVPMSLKKRWFHQGRARSSGDGDFVQDRSIAQLSRISEVNSNFVTEIISEEPNLQRSTSTPEDPSRRNSEEHYASKKEVHGEPSKAKKRSLTLMESPFGKSLGRAITRLSNITLSSDRKDENAKIEAGEGKNEAMEKHDEDKSGWSYRLSKPFVEPELTTPDFNKDVENMALR
ncbi:hypothetical protein A1O1_03636 [Capronia coronata CBS 617.96]|uniref:Uncharacterized protein n=1 Tax=Capronia coronata CBS 617.96 TaxID=1182541 RepID=W9YDD0_9EURO|nr:uncharacterized protein A1O1_03636 [Capronia coronata CBS 617.96]EXJ90533.1 hypothetical protein A1O1_03636 [Capronia coronata CBS 617.96]